MQEQDKEKPPLVSLSLNNVLLSAAEPATEAAAERKQRKCGSNAHSNAMEEMRRWGFQLEQTY